MKGLYVQLLINTFFQRFGTRDYMQVIKTTYALTTITVVSEQSMSSKLMIIKNY